MTRSDSSHLGNNSSVISSLMVHLPGVLVMQVKQPIHCLIFFWRRFTTSTSAPASRIPLTRLIIINSVLLWPPLRRLLLIANTFFIFFNIRFHFHFLHSRDACELVERFLRYPLGKHVLDTANLCALIVVVFLVLVVGIVCWELVFDQLRDHLEAVEHH